MNEKNKIIIPNNCIETLKAFEKDFLEYNTHTNLISRNDSEVIFDKHICDSLALQLFLDKYNLNETKQKLLDIGTGGGFPALPLAFCYKNIDILALDSTAKKIAFITKIRDKYNLSNLKAICERIEELPEIFLEDYDITTSRALSRLNVICEYSLPYLKIGGYLVAYKSKLVDEEIEEAQNALNILGGKIIDKIEYTLNLKEEFERNLVIIKKVSKTPDNFPRANGIILKRPLK